MIIKGKRRGEIIDTLAGAYAEDFWHTFNAIYTYVMGFTVLGLYWAFHYWAFHHYMFHFIKRSNGVLVWLNILFLMFAALVPLSTKVNRTHPESYQGFAFNMLTTIITFLLLLVI